MTHAIIKPDHLGDLILSSPAIRAITALHPDSVLFVASRNVALANYLFPGTEIRTIEFAHLSKASGADRIPDLREFETVAFLRSDGVITENWAALRTHGFLLPMDTHDAHQSMIDYTVASWLVGDYDIDAAFFGDRLRRIAAKALSVPRRVGLSIGSGFHANAWPVLRWVEAARHLLTRTDTLTILCGPAERNKAAFIAKQIGQPAAVEIVVGGGDFGAFVSSVDDLDLVVASDGGTAHLCSLVTPIVSVFGPSPFRRYAPYGRWNRLLTRQMACSPCCQYATELVNGCLTTECMTQITTKHLDRALAVSLDAQPRAGALRIDDDVHLHVGVSHAARERHIARYRRDARRMAIAEPELGGVFLTDQDGLLTDLQAARLALVDAVDRLKRAPAAGYAARVRRILLRFADLQQASADVRAYLARREREDHGGTPGQTS